MKQKNRSFLRMGGLVLVLVLALTALVTMAGASVAPAPDQSPIINAPQAAIANPATMCAVATGSVSCDLYAETGTLDSRNNSNKNFHDRMSVSST